VHLALSKAPLHIDEVQRRSGLSAGQVASALAMLELKGRIRQVGGMHYVRVREAGKDYRVD
jgi:DNA processing protein